MSNRQPHPYGDRGAFREAAPAPLVERAIPVAGELPGYAAATARGDLVAGLTVAALAIPSAMAYAELAGLSPVNGLYALILPGVLYVLLGSSRQLVVGPEGTVATLVAAAVLPLAAAGGAAATELAAMLALMVASCFLLARLLRLGWIADYFSRPVLVGYIHGVAVVLVVGQLGKLLGLSIDAQDPLAQLGEVMRELGDTSGDTLLVGGLALATLLVLRVRAPRFPAALVLVVAAIAASWALGLGEQGVAVVGEVPSGLPSVDVPSPALDDVSALLPAAAGIFLVSFADEILTARSFAGRHDQHVSVSQELTAMAAANAAAGLTRGFPIAASGSRTSVNDAMGARTQLAGLAAAATVAVILLFLTAPIQYLPKAVLGAVIVSAAVGLIEPGAWRALASVDPVEAAIAGVTTGGVIAFGVLEALIVAVGLSIIEVVRRSSRPHDAVLGWVEQLGRYADVSLHRSAKVTPGVVVYRLDDRLAFVNAGYVKGRVQEAVRAAPQPVSWLVFDAEAVTHVDSTGLAALEVLVQSLRRQGITLVAARLKAPMRERFDDAGLTDTIGRERFHATVREAVDACAASMNHPTPRSVDAPPAAH